MRHDITLKGKAFRLRPVTLDDAAFIVELRTRDPVRNRYIHQISTDVSLQRAWLQRYFDRVGDYYFIVENAITGAPVGTGSIYDIDAATKSGEWGRWVLLPNTLAALESAFLLHKAAFERLGLGLVFIRTIAENAKAVAFHDNFGAERHTTLPGAAELNGAKYDLVEHRMTPARWRACAQQLAQSIDAIAERVARAAGH